jgi:hypothetical protein
MFSALTEPYGQYHTKETDTMFTKATLGLAVILATASGALAATKTHSIPTQSGYNSTGAYVGTDPDLNVRFELNRDWGRGQ